MDQNKELMKNDFSEKQQLDNGDFSLLDKIIAFIQLVRKRNFRFRAIFALSRNLNLSCLNTYLNASLCQAYFVVLFYLQFHFGV